MSNDYAPQVAEVGRRIAEAIGDMTQEAVAKRVGVTQPTVGRWIAGKAIPEMVTLRRLADTLGVPAAWLLQPLLGDAEPADTDDLLREVAEARTRIDRLESRLRGLPPRG